jgi:hypothetical protein
MFDLRTNSCRDNLVNKKGVIACSEKTVAPTSSKKPLIFGIVIVVAVIAGVVYFYTAKKSTSLAQSTTASEIPISATQPQML